MGLASWKTKWGFESRPNKIVLDLMNSVKGISHDIFRGKKGIKGWMMLQGT
jgi:hypothetical protein